MSSCSRRRSCGLAARSRPDAGCAGEAGAALGPQPGQARKAVLQGAPRCCGTATSMPASRSSSSAE
eukprot:5787636-Lingulodinium_polyedra.AAC.1